MRKLNCEHDGIKKSTIEVAKYPQLMQDILTKAMLSGVTDAFVSINHDRGFAVEVRMKEVETVTFSEDKEVNLVVYLGHSKGVASTTLMSSHAIEDLVKAAINIAKVSAEDKAFGLPDKELMRTEYPCLDLFHPWDITPENAIEECIKCETIGLDADKRIINSDGVNLSTYEFCHGFANSLGGSGLIQSTRHTLSCSLLAKEHNSMQREYEYTTARNSQDLEGFIEVAKVAAERTVSRLKARKIKTQKVPILFSSRVSASLFNSFVSAISGMNLYRKNSFLLNSLGTQVFPAGIKIYEQPFILRGLGSSPFDGEGVPTRENVFVENGVVQQYILNSYAARRLNLKTSANSGGVHNLMIEYNSAHSEKTTQNLTTLLKLMNKGFLVTDLMGQGVNSLTGDYSRGASGFWVENGEIQYPVEEVTIACNLKDMFKKIQAIGTDINSNVATRCGSVLVSEMTIGGE